MELFQTKWFAKFARQERILVDNLRDAIVRAERGHIDADLGGGLIKQRVARQGKGRSGGYRMIVAYRTAERAIFLYAFAKSDQDNIGSSDLSELRKVGMNYLLLPPTTMHRFVEDGALKEIPYADE